MYVFIVNPVAGNGRAKKIHSHLMKLDEYKKLKPICYFTKYRGHAEEIAKEVDKLSPKRVVVIGGDGTMHEVINGLKNRHIELSFIPGGSGNDFARGAILALKPKEAFRNTLASSRPLDYWIGIYKEQEKTERKFINCIGFGFDAVVTQNANRSRFKKMFNKLKLGTVVYTMSLVRELLFYKPIPITIETEATVQTFHNCFLITVNNHPYFGGGMKINPDAKNNCDSFLVLVIDSISKWKVLALFVTVFSGKHLSFKEVSTLKANQIKISAEKSIPFQADGETGCTKQCFITKEPLPLKVKGRAM